MLFVYELNKLDTMSKLINFRGAYHDISKLSGEPGNLFLFLSVFSLQVLS